MMRVLHWLIAGAAAVRAASESSIHVEVESLPLAPVLITLGR